MDTYYIEYHIKYYHTIRYLALSYHTRPQSAAPAERRGGKNAAALGGTTVDFRNFIVFFWAETLAH